jgi:hypothetical protein
MSKRLLAATLGAALIGCGEKAQEMKNAANALEAVADMATNAEATQNEAEKFYAERQAKGDTVAMNYAELQKLLPEAPSGYTASGEPGGSSQSMGGWSMAQAEQTYSQPAGADGNTPSIKVSLMDFGGTQAAYGMMALPMMMNLSQEDAHRRFNTIKLGPEFTSASEEYNKDNKDVTVTAMTRYRYMITVEARNQSSDQSDLVKGLAEEIAKKFAGK